MKALILAGGTGSRLRPITYSMAKQLVPVANKPVIEYGIESIAEAGVTEFGIITGDTGPAVQAAVGNGSRWGIEITYIPQSAPLGLAHAVSTAKDFLGDDDFIMYLGDNLIKSSVTGLVKEFETHRPAATILLTQVPNPSDFGVAEMSDGKVSRLEEKPKQPRSNLALVGVYLFDRRVHDSIAKLKPSKRGEYEITDAIQGLIDDGLEVRSHIVDGWWKDTGTVEAMLDANRLILEDIEPRNDGEAYESKIEGRVVVGKGTRIVGSTIRGPAVIGENCLIENSFIGPFSAIDSNTEIKNTEIEYSIVLADCRLDRVPGRIEGSLIGRGVTVSRCEKIPRTLKLVLGDSSAVILP
ncbi:MAG TPA: glucose-1-phosphate thymidylyltransferase [Fimbriimonadaceae bacterium]|nr:glucose-1-phosphate thymidylyltransferase [Fimbriimonadaceae bacterium]